MFAINPPRLIANLIVEQDEGKFNFKLSDSLKFSRRSINENMDNVVSLPIRIDLSVGKGYCTADVDCVACIPQYTSKKCTCPNRYELQPDNSCTNMVDNHHIPTPRQMAAKRTKMSFHERFRGRFGG